jgi:uncharacterized protein YcfL
MKSLAFFAVALFVVVGCQSSHQEGVKSDYRTQWTSVNADTKATTSAAEAVLASAQLQDIKANSTNVDGSVHAKKADGTKVNVAIKKQDSGSGSEVSVTVGTMGDPALGAEWARKIKDRAEGR